MVTIRANINRKLLTWARTSAGYSVAEAAQKIGGKGFDPQRLEAWESGKTQPTVIQIRKIARIYKRPLATFFLSEFPRDFTIPHDFRRLPGEGRQTVSPALRLQVRSAEERRELALELYDELGERIPELSITASIEDDPETLGARIREALGITFEDQVGWRDPSRYTALREWRTRLEQLGVLVFQFPGIEPSEVLGFSLAESVVPVVALNRKIKPNGRIFTMLHEVAHLMLRRSGLCDLDEDYYRPPEENRVEVFCNHTAAATLLPTHLLLREPSIQQHPPRAREWADKDIDYLADRYSVSREVVVRRLLILGRATEAFYRRKRALYKAQFAERERTEVKSSGYESQSSKAVNINGPAFVRLVLENYYQERITLSDVSSYLNVRVKHLPRIEQAVLAT